MQCRGRWGGWADADQNGSVGFEDMAIVAANWMEGK
jgi:hypothetical protein